MKQLSFLLIIICAFTACKQSTKETENRINSQIENNDNIKVIATGGLARLIASESETIDIVNGLLTLEGLRIIYERNKEQHRTEFKAKN